MQLLSGQQVAHSSHHAEQERKARIAKINKEESDAVLRLNALLDEERKTKARIATEEEQMQVAHTAKVTALKSEVEALEERKKAAEAPIKVTLTEAQQIKDENARYQTHLLERIEKHEEARDLYFTKFEDLSDREQIITERESALDKREERVTASEGTLKASTEELGAKWVAYHTAVHTLNESMKVREREVSDAWKAIAVVRESQDKRAKELQLYDYQLRDRSKTLEIAALEIRGY